MSTSSTATTQPLLTKGKLWTVFFLQLNEAYQITVLLPMVVFMVRGFGIEPRLLGIYTSLLNASFCFCQFLCCYSWGVLSDKYGRRIALVSGLIFSSIAILVFGVSKDFATAMTARCISGFFNGNLGVMKAYVADVTDKTNRAWAFSILAISYGFGSVLGSMCGGILIETHDVDVPWDEYVHTTGVVKFWIFEHEYPFLLPCLIGALISFNALIWTLINVHNEKIIYIPTAKKSVADTNDYNAITSDIDSMMISTLDDGWNNQHKSLNELAKLAIIETVPGDGIHNVNLSLLSFQSGNDQQMAFLLSPLGRKQNEERAEPYSTVCSLMFDTSLYHTLVIWTALVMCFMMYQEMNPVYMAQALQFSSVFIGYAMAYSGVCLLLFVYYIQPWFLRTFRFRSMCILCGVVMAIVMLQMPSIYTIIYEFNIANGTFVALMISFGNSMIGICAASILFVCAMCWVNNSVPNRYVGRANGLGQSLAALVRAIGPTLTGFIWSASVNHIEQNKISVYYAYLPSFILCIIIAMWIYLFIKDDTQLMWEERQTKQQNRILL